MQNLKFLKFLTCPHGSKVPCSEPNGLYKWLIFSCLYKLADIWLKDRA